MRKGLLLFYMVLGIVHLSVAQKTTYQNRVELKVGSQTFWWAGIINDGNKMPLDAPYSVDFRTSNHSNQVQPLMMSNDGEVIWSEEPYKIDFGNGILRTQGDGVSFDYVEAGKNLKDAYYYASKNYFPPSGKMPNKLLFSHPQYNTWIELMYDQNQKDIMKYAQSIIDNGFPPGVLMIDDNWQEDYGKWNFHPGRFSDPEQMIEKLHAMGFKVMLWVCPFVSPDSDVYRKLRDEKLFITNDDGQPAMIHWWNGVSAVLDFTNPKAVDWFKSQLNHLTSQYKVDGFKFDAGDFRFYTGVHSYKPVLPPEQAELYGKIALDYGLNEFRAMWKMGGQPLAERLADKRHGFAPLQKLIPNMLTANLMGYYFSCPDMIGGGEYKSFLDEDVLDQESIVRSAQCHALMPMMQFSVAPWRVLDPKYFRAVKKAVQIREKFSDYILKLANKAAQTGEPIMKPMEFDYPHEGYAKIVDQFLLGDDILVAPVLTKGAQQRSVVIPDGKWKSFDGRVIDGPQTIRVKVTLNDLPYFEKIN